MWRRLSNQGKPVMEALGPVMALVGLSCAELKILHKNVWAKAMTLKHRAPENYHAFMLVLRNIEIHMLAMHCHD